MVRMVRLRLSGRSTGGTQSQLRVGWPIVETSWAILGSSGDQAGAGCLFEEALALDPARSHSGWVRSGRVVVPLGRLAAKVRCVTIPTYTAMALPSRGLGRRRNGPLLMDIVAIPGFMLDFDFVVSVSPE